MAGLSGVTPLSLESLDIVQEISIAGQNICHVVIITDGHTTSCVHFRYKRCWVL